MYVCVYVYVQVSTSSELVYIRYLLCLTDISYVYHFLVTCPLFHVYML